MVEGKTKLGYLVATPELRRDEDAKPCLTHIHVCDSNRLAPGRGNFDFGKIISMIKATGYNGHISAEIYQYPDRDIVI